MDRKVRSYYRMKFVASNSSKYVLKLCERKPSSAKVPSSKMRFCSFLLRVSLKHRFPHNSSVCSYEGLTLDTSATPQNVRAVNISYQPSLVKNHIQSIRTWITRCPTSTTGWKRCHKQEIK